LRAVCGLVAEKVGKLKFFEKLIGEVVEKFKQFRGSGWVSILCKASHRMIITLHRIEKTLNLDI
jgi:hypothetical protein